MKVFGLILAALFAAPGVAQQATVSLKPAPTPIIRTEVSLVVVPVTVITMEGRFVTGLNFGDFRVFDNKEEQEILHCSVEDTPVSIVIVFDNSGSMSSKMDNSRKALAEFVKINNPQDEYSLVAFHDHAEVLRDWTDAKNIMDAILVAGKPNGKTALLDALYLGINQTRTAKNGRKAIILITDGGDNNSRYNEHDIKRALVESDVQFYAIGIFNASFNQFGDPRAFPTHEEMMGPTLLEELTGMTGGLAYAITPDNTGILDQRLFSDLAVHIGRAIRDQYILSYKPQMNKAHDGQRHKLKVKVRSPKGMGPFNVYARTGYVAGAL